MVLPRKVRVPMLPALPLVPGESDPLIAANRGFGDVLHALTELPQLLVCAVDGSAMGGGFGLACCADIVLATQRSVFATPEVTLGLPPAQIAPFVWRRLGDATARQCLLIADAHFGKASAYRSLGQPVPQGTTTENLLRLDRLLAAVPCAQVIFLGDLLHSAHGRAAGTLEAFARWRRGRAARDLVLVRGNHDDRAGDPPPETGIDVVNEPWLLGPFACCHHPRPDGDRHPTHFILAGHLHPVVHLSGRARDAMPAWPAASVPAS